MLVNLNNSIAYIFLSAGTGASGVNTTDILFYINLGLIFCALAQFVALIVLCKKTSCAVVIGLAAVLLFGLGIILFFTQMFLYVYKNPNAMYCVYLCLSVQYAAFIMSGIYTAMLLRNSHGALCLVAALGDIVPPLGATFTVLLSYKINRDTSVQEYVYNGYAYTYAALHEYCEMNKAEFIDLAGTVEFEQLDNKGVRAKLRALKANSKTPSGRYDYAVALATYKPDKLRKALGLMHKAAIGNHAPALFNMGYYHELGIYFGKDYKKAKAFYTKAAELGDNDAALRLGILEIKCGSKVSGEARMREIAQNNNDICARYNLGVCAEFGVVEQPNIDKALEIYDECGRAGFFTAEKRMFAIAAEDINSAQNSAIFNKVASRKYSGSFAVMIKGLSAIKKRQAADAAELFLSVVKRRDKWEGLARCLVGTLYIDCGKEMRDKCNGAEYIQSALKLMPSAKDVLSVVPHGILRRIKKRERVRLSRRPKTNNSDGTAVQNEQSKKD